MLFAVFFLPAVFASKIVCPDKSHECPESATCCQLPDQTYGCCPMKNAVCCDDHIHCCPEGSHCDLDMCVQVESNNSSLTENVQYVCPGGEYTCPDDSTCCMNSQGKVYGCCLLPDAICCSDGQQCCPKDSTCDLQHQRCISKGYELQMYDAHKSVNKPLKVTVKNLKKLKVIPVNSSKLYFFQSSAKRANYSSIICPGGSFQCPDGYTCCQLPQGDWGCCPFAGATCCPDKLHCCPNHMKCDVTSSTCLQGTQNVTWFENIRAEKVA